MTPGEPLTEPILVPLDGSSNAERALRPAKVLADGLGCPLRVVHVLGGEAAANPEEKARATGVFTTYVRRLAARRHLDANAIQVAVLEGAPADAILSASQSARMIVLASHGRGGFRAAILGSVADRVVRGAEKPVLLVRGTRTEHGPVAIRRAVVCLDGSEQAERGLEFARELTARAGVSLVLLRTFSAPKQVTGEDFLYYDPKALTPQLEEAARTYLQAHARPGETVLAVEGAPAEAIARVAKDQHADAIIVTTRGMGLARRLILGSVTDKVIRSAKLPVFIIPAAAAEEA